MAYVLLNTEIGAERDVLREIRGVDGVQEAFYLWGIYDIIALVRADTMNKLTNIINKHLQLGKIHSKLTVLVMEPEEKALVTEPLTC
jgi:DNA-binding Lrp family transcriptional regulator